MIKNNPTFGERLRSLAGRPMNEILREVKMLPDSTGLLRLSETLGNKNPAVDFLRQMPPHAEYEFDLDHFDLGDFQSSDPQISALLEELLAANQFMICLADQVSGPLVAERCFIAQAQGRNRKLRPLIVHFTSSLGEKTLHGFSQLYSEYGRAFEVVHVGVQFHDCGRKAFDLAGECAMTVLPLKSLSPEGLYADLCAVTEIGFNRPTWISLDLNSLAFAQGGGTKSWATGLELSQLISALEWMSRQTFVQGLSAGPLDDLHPAGVSVRSLGQLFSSLIFAQSQRQVVSYVHGETNV